MLFLVNVLRLVLGTFMDMAPMRRICTPILLPVMIMVVRFGMIMLVNCDIGLITPPVGPTLFVGCALGRVSMEEVSREPWLFYGDHDSSSPRRHLRARAVALAPELPEVLIAGDGRTASTRDAPER
jgi:hypothetical protein